jgi:hypothetical protein
MVNIPSYRLNFKHPYNKDDVATIFRQLPSFLKTLFGLTSSPFFPPSIRNATSESGTDGIMMTEKKRWNSQWAPADAFYLLSAGLVDIKYIFLISCQCCYIILQSYQCPRYIYYVFNRGRWTLTRGLLNTIHVPYAVVLKPLSPVLILAYCVSLIMQSLESAALVTFDVFIIIELHVMLSIWYYLRHNLRGKYSRY